jgi:hypothetical protein
LSVSEDEELAKLGRLLEIDVGEALGLGITEVWRRWFSISNNAAAALELWEVIERRGGDTQSPVDRSLVGHWGNLIDLLDTTWVHSDGTPYAHNEASVPRGEGRCPNTLDTKFEQGGYFDACSDRPDVWADLRAWGGPYIDWDGVPYANYNEEE